ncbi:hypothetical protein FRC20_001342 [Serendipita sp. 405]|nr:hypothetical protein FRC15_011013 [Serendipita sp. 397]KAG8852995.1 hypothetical protein FRC20_001342 [Serendipita sp. 405]
MTSKGRDAISPQADSRTRAQAQAQDEKEQPPGFSSSSTSADTGVPAYAYICPLAAAALLLQRISLSSSSFVPALTLTPPEKNKMEFSTNVIEAVFGVPKVDDIPVDEDTNWTEMAAP